MVVIERVNFNVQKSLITIFLVAARPSVGHSYHNSVKLCHDIANIGLQSVRMIRRSSGNIDIGKLCDKDLKFREEFKKSMETPRELIKNVLSLKDERFKFLRPAGDVDLYNILTNMISYQMQKQCQMQNTLSDKT